MPQSPRTHRISRQSVAAFELLLGDQFIFRREDPDYAIDGVVEEISASDVLTGLRFYVQLKATDQTDLKRALAMSLPLSDRDYYRSLSLPVLMVLHHAPSDTFYTRWISEHDPYRDRGGKKTFTFRWSETDAWDGERGERLIAEAAVFRELRSPDSPLPRPFHLVSKGAFGLSSDELTMALRAAAAPCADVIAVRGGPPVGGAGWIEIGESEVAVNLAKVTGAELHLSDNYDPGELGENVANDALLMSAPAFANVGQFGIASRVISELGPQSGLLADPAIIFSLQAIMSAARRVRESLELADALDRSANPEIRETSIFFTLPALRHGATLSASEKELQKKTLRRRVVRRKQDGDGAGQAREKVNLANLHRGRGEGTKAVRLYREAAEADPDYLKRSYYWCELGGVLWMGRRYEEAAEAYEKAISLGAPPIAEALRADSLLYAGHYRRALELFEIFNREYPDLAAEYRLKEIALGVIVEQMGIETQVRDTDGAVRASPNVGKRASPEQVIEGSLSQLRRDALWPSAWYNVGIAEGRRDNGRAALKAFLAATTLMPVFDLEPWSHAAFWAWRLGEADLLRDILATARRLAGAPILAEMIRFGRSQDATFPRDALLDTVGGILDEMPPESRAGYTIRVSGPDGAEEFEVAET